METRQQRLLRKAAEAEKRLARIRAGAERPPADDEGREIEDALGVYRWRAKGLSQKTQHFAQKASANFHMPIARAYRLTNADGATSFHFSHRFINRVEHEMCEDGLRNRPNAARGHARYVEREAVVARLDPEQAARPIETADISAAPATTSEGSKHDQYVGRAEATALRPNGSRAILTNIDADEEERAKFWSTVEKHEAVASPDQMSLKVADRSEFWSRALRDPQCPEELRAALQQINPDDHVRFEIPSGKIMRRFLATQPGWVKPGAPSRDDQDELQTPFARFHDGRKGRTQYRVIGELPEELSVEERFRIVEEFSGLFARRRLPFVAVMHAPDHHNDERNWHFHLIYHDRPSRRISQEDIDRLQSAGFSTGGLEPGMWDFAVVTPKRNRTNGKATPLKQNKNREVTSQGWVEMLRGELAAITNNKLAAAGVERRVDPRTHAEMGIAGDPQEHLGTKQAAVETRGGVTVTGIENERRQWAAILAEADARLERGLATTRQFASPLQAGSDAASADGHIVRKEALETAAHLDVAAFRLQQSIERAQSRAHHVQRTNRRLFKAYEADPASCTRDEKDIAEALLDASTEYLSNFDRTLQEERALVDECRLAAREIRDRPLTEREPIKRSEPPRPVRPVELERPSASTSPSPNSPSPPASQPEPTKSPADEKTGAPPPMSEAAKRAAMLAAMQQRSRGR